MTFTAGGGRPVINIDLDGVVYNFDETLRQYASEVLGRQLPATTKWSIWEDWGVPRGAWENLFRKGVESGVVWRTGRPIEGAIEGLWALSDAEYYIRIVTHRLNHPSLHRQAITYTAEWLDENSIPYRDIAFIGPASKTQFEAQILVEDNAPNAKEFMREYGKAILLRQPWNNMVSPEPGLMIASDWTDITGLVMQTVEVDI